MRPRSVLVRARLDGALGSISLKCIHCMYCTRHDTRGGQTRKKATATPFDDLVFRLRSYLLLGAPDEGEESLMLGPPAAKNPTPFSEALAEGGSMPSPGGGLN